MLSKEYIIETTKKDKFQSLIKTEVERLPSSVLEKRENRRTSITMYYCNLSGFICRTENTEIAEIVEKESFLHIQFMRVKQKTTKIVNSFQKMFI